MTGAGDLGFVHAAAYTVFPTGEIVIDNDVKPFGDVPPLPKLGLSMRVPTRFDRLEWLGRGPGESYPDRKRSCDVGRWAVNVDDVDRALFENYVRPQEHGNREDVRWASLTDVDGHGLLVAAGRELLKVTATRYAPLDLELARHRPGQKKRYVPPKQQDAVLFSIDVDQMGLGGASCGPRPMNDYVLRPEHRRFRVSIRPPRAESERAEIPVAEPPSVARDKEAYLRMNASRAAATIAFTLDGTYPGVSAPIYEKPLRWTDAATVRAVARLPGYVDSAVVHLDIEKTTPLLELDKRKWRIVRADSEEPGEGWAKHAIDGRPDTFWHTSWSQAKKPYPHELVVDLGETYCLVGVSLLPRHGSANGWIRDYELRASRDGESWSDPVAAGTLDATGSRKVLAFATAVDAKYLKLSALSEARGAHYASLAELDVLATGQSTGLSVAWPQGTSRTWTGPESWANRLQDWRLHDGRVECLETNPRRPMRTLHLLTASVGEAGKSFFLRTTLRPVEPERPGDAEHLGRLPDRRRRSGRRSPSHGTRPRPPREGRRPGLRHRRHGTARVPRQRDERDVGEPLDRRRGAGRRRARGAHAPRPHEPPSTRESPSGR